MMKSFAAIACLALLVAVSPVFAEGQIIGLKLTGEQPLGAVKVVSGKAIIDGASDVRNRTTVWVNGVSGEVDPSGQFRVIIPNEELTSVVAFQTGYNVMVVAMAQEDGSMPMAVVRGSDEIRDLLSKKEGIRDLLKNGGQGGKKQGEIRDLLGGGGQKEGIRDLLRPVSAAGESIRDLLRGGKGGGQTEGIRDLLKDGKGQGSGQSSDQGIRDLLKP